MLWCKHEPDPTSCRSNGFDFYDTSGVLQAVDDTLLDSRHMRKTKIVCTLGPTSSTPEAITEMADKGMNVCRMNMSHGDHDSHGAVVDKIKDYNKLNRGCLSILLDTKVWTLQPECVARAYSVCRTRAHSVGRACVTCMPSRGPQAARLA